MPELNLRLAWQRLKQDRPRRCFVQHPYALTWIHRQIDEWLAALTARIDAGYTPSPAILCQVPKQDPLVRPGLVLDYADETLFNAVLGDFHPQIFEVIRWSQGDPDIAYQLQEPTGNAAWLKTDVWGEFREKSLKRLEDGGVQFVAMADIAAFYENVDLGRLFSDLRLCDVGEGHLELLSNLLRRWAGPRGKGIPQGHSSSHILAKLYLNEVDQGLRNAGFDHLRYVDDIRIFCKTRLEARKALLMLSGLLRNRGLNLQSAKTDIVRIDDATKQIDGVAPVIKAIHKDLAEEMNEALEVILDGSELLGARVDPEDVDTDNPPSEVLEEAFRNHFLSPTVPFKKTLFHRLLTLLGRAQSTVAVQYCIEQISQRPEETEDSLRYLVKVDALGDSSDQILRFAGSPDAIYDYQLYQIARAFYDARLFPPRLLQLCRTWSQDRNREPWLRTYSIAILGAAGNTSDLASIHTFYDSASSEFERAELARALARLERTRRNSFFNGIRNDGNLVQWAIEDAKQAVP